MTRYQAGGAGDPHAFRDPPPRRWFVRTALVAALMVPGVGVLSSLSAPRERARDCAAACRRHLGTCTRAGHAGPHYCPGGCRWY